MIPANNIVIDGDTAWWVGADPRNLRGVDELLDRPCDTCGGYGEVMGRDHDLVNGDPCPADCIDGRHTFDIETPCDCERCRGERLHTRVRVSIVPGMVLPIYHEDHPDESIPDGQHHIVYAEGAGAFDLYEWEHDMGFWQCDQNITLPPAAAPGMFAVKLKEKSDHAG